MLIRHILFLLATPCVGACTQNIQYFPESRAPFVCNLSGSTGAERGAEWFEPLALARNKDAFAVRDTRSSNVVLVANRMKVLSATARAFYDETLGERVLSGVKLMLVVGLEVDSSIFANASQEIKELLPSAHIIESRGAEIVVDLYSTWLGTEYARRPCDGVAMDAIPIDAVLTGRDAREFLESNQTFYVLAGRLFYKDAISGWRFHRSFSVKRSDFVLLGS